MTETAVAKLLEEAIQLELLVADLYVFFCQTYPEDAGFWWKLSLEEKNHAALLRSGREHFLPVGQFPAELIPSVLGTLTVKNRELAATIDRFREAHPDRAEAFRFAFELENSAGELHFQHAMADHHDSESQAMEIFRNLNRDDRDHAERIRQYMRNNKIG